jgi:hypothetical protein
MPPWRMEEPRTRAVRDALPYGRASDGQWKSSRNRARHVVRNSPIAARAVQSLAGNTVGCGVKLLLRLVNQPSSRASRRVAYWLFDSRHGLDSEWQNGL